MNFCRLPHLLLPLLLFTWGCGDDPDEAATDPYRQAAEKAAAAVDLARLKTVLTTLAADDMEGRDNLTAGSKKARDYLAAELKALGITPQLQTFDKGVNLLGLLPGADQTLAGEVVMLGAHYDHLGKVGAANSQCRASPGNKDTICNGATDNASGCALVLEVAAALIKSGAKPRRSLIFAFWDAEEDGLYGSKHYAEKMPLANIVASLNVDTVGTEIIPGDSSSFALGAEYATGLRELVHKNSSHLGFKTHPVSSFFVGDGKGGRSDHYPFRLKQVPILFFSSGVNSVYHTPADEVDQVKWDKLVKTTKHVLLTLTDVANASAKPTFVKDPKPNLDDGRALVALGAVVLKNPAALGITDQNLINMLKNLLSKVQGYLDDPPDTQEEWDSYQSLVKSIITMVFMYI